MTTAPGRFLGAALLVAAYAPLHRLLDPARAGPAGAATRDAAEAVWRTGLYGTLLIVGGAYVTSRLVPGGRVVGIGGRLADVLARPSHSAFAAATGAVALLLSASVALLAFGRLPTSVDEMAQLLHARALADGMWALPLPGPDAAWSIQNGVLTPLGWASIYPPLHTLALAAGLRLGGSWLVGPVLVGLATVLSTLTFERLLGRRLGRAAGALLSVTPFWLLLGATHLSHSTAAAALALVLWTAVRARDGAPAWAIACGAAIGAAVTARPWIGLASSAVVVAGAWALAGARPARGALVRRLGGLAAGGVPFAVLLFAWNERLFGNPWTLGYSAAFGSSHGLGLHPDPWGNLYGLREAVAYSAADLVQLGGHLLESPLPAVAIVGLGLLLRPEPRASVFAAWVVGALGANALYWHHGNHLGPRMLYESTPAWIALFVVAAHGLSTHPPLARGRGAGVWALALALGAGLVLAPGAASVRASGVAVTEARIPEAGAGPALVFVHGSWSSRIAARLTVAGMRRDSVETALRRNDVCAVDRYARGRSPEAAAAARSATLELESLPGSPERLRTRLLSPGNAVRVAPDGSWDATCVREGLADRLGVIELELLLWQAPPSRARRTVVARDLGPTANDSVRAALGASTTQVLIAGSDPGDALLLDYDDGMELLWRGAAGAYAEPRARSRLPSSLVPGPGG